MITKGTILDEYQGKWLFISLYKVGMVFALVTITTLQ